MTNIEFRAQLIATLFIPKDTLVFDNFVQRLIDIQNETLEEAAILADKRKNTYGGEFADYYYGRNSAAEDIGDDIRAMKVQ